MSELTPNRAAVKGEWPGKGFPVAFETAGPDSRVVWEWEWGELSEV